MGLFNRPRKKNEVEVLIEGYLNTVTLCCDSFHHSMQEYFSTGLLTDEFMRYERQTHQFESEGDDRRHALEEMMYEKGLIPQSRGDIMALLEAMDHVPDQMEAVVQTIYTEAIQLPANYRERFTKLTALNVETVQKSVALFLLFLRGERNVRESVRHIDQVESQSDRLERELVYGIFRDPQIRDVEKLILRNLIVVLGRISDEAEDFAELVGVCAVKRLF
ncbi:MAG: hypothetical protein A3K19_30740 [Lentisphaerae bacterium RIFOXYB12_FULL_65_16]|nr:MAG: hypothetical protein A3K18_04155 [Lentisphaerae bacterium RIFOXYA12_64_32]OGV88796.1 MAG: hypothetical protein A3K19_30740 [Lentisphaerae bacterium RIFOXYB12_FULL_65_16]